MNMLLKHYFRLGSKRKILVNCRSSAYFSSNNCTREEPKFFMTSPVVVASESPQLGHLHSAVISDAAFRFHKLLNPEDDYIFGSGCSEHGLKVERASQSVGKDPLMYCSSVSSSFKTLFEECNIDFTHFIRTTDPNHKIAVQYFLQVLFDKGLIYEDVYKGWYCVSEESFLTDSQLLTETLDDGSEVRVSAESGHPVEWNEEVNYIFKLSAFQKDLLDWLRSGEKVVPNKFSKEVETFVAQGLTDLSISRPKSRVSWGVPLPWDANHTTYVWVDALVNYLTVGGYPDIMAWPPSLQVVGKDILRFHAVYWPALLMGAGLEPPSQLRVHCNFTLNAGKISNQICPLDLVKRVTGDGFRYMLLRKGSSLSDCAWYDIPFISSINQELQKNVANLLGRVTSTFLNPEQIFPPIGLQPPTVSPLDYEYLMKQLDSMPYKVGRNYSNFQFNLGAKVIRKLLGDINRFINKQNLKKLSEDYDTMNRDFVLGLTLTALKMSGIALQPLVPSISDNLLTNLGVPKNQRSWIDLEKSLNNSKRTNLGEQIILFKKIRRN